MFYSPYFFFIIFFTLQIVIVFFILLDIYKNNTRLGNIIEYFYVISLILLFGFRPIGENGFTDTPMYIEWFTNTKEANKIINHNDWGFDIFLYLYSLVFSNPRFLFFIVAAFTIFIYYLLSKKIVTKNWFYLFVGITTFLYFWDFNVFMIRQGLASAIFLLALITKKKWQLFILLILSISIHKSLIIPSFAYIISFYIKNIKVNLLLYLLVSIVSYFFVYNIISIFAGFISDTRFKYYIIDQQKSLNNIKFRWDIFFFNILIILYFFKFGITQIDRSFKNENELYKRIFNTFLITNTFVSFFFNTIAPYRFAYLAWDMIPLILYIPVLKNKKKTKKNSYKLILILTFLIVLCYYFKREIYL